MVTSVYASDESAVDARRLPGRCCAAGGQHERRALDGQLFPKSPALAVDLVGSDSP